MLLRRSPFVNQLLLVIDRFLLYSAYVLCFSILVSKVLRVYTESVRRNGSWLLGRNDCEDVLYSARSAEVH